MSIVSPRGKALSWRARAQPRISTSPWYSTFTKAPFRSSLQNNTPLPSDERYRVVTVLRSLLVPSNSSAESCLST